VDKFLTDTASGIIAGIVAPTILGVLAVAIPQTRAWLTDRRQIWRAVFVTALLTAIMSSVGISLFLRSQTITLTSRGSPRDPPANLIWESPPCPLKTHVISGICTILCASVPGGKCESAPPLQNFGPTEDNRWSCTWQVSDRPITAAVVRAVCLRGALSHE
jgi:hypothetical protein